MKTYPNPERGGQKGAAESDPNETRGPVKQPMAAVWASFSTYARPHSAAQVECVLPWRVTALFRGVVVAWRAEPTEPPVVASDGHTLWAPRPWVGSPKD